MPDSTEPLDGSDNSPLDPATLNGKRGWPLKSALHAPLGSTLDGLGRSLLGSAFDGLSSSPLTSAHNGLNSVPLCSKLDSSSSNTLLGSALDIVGTSTLSSALDEPNNLEISTTSSLKSALDVLSSSKLDSAILDGLNSSPSMLGSALDGSKLYPALKSLSSSALYVARYHILWLRPLAPTERASSCRLMCPNTDDILRHSQRLASLCHQSEHLQFATVELWQQMNASTCIARLSKHGVKRPREVHTSLRLRQRLLELS